MKAPVSPLPMLQAMGDKTAARRMAQECNVPVVPGTDDALESAEAALVRGCMHERLCGTWWWHAGCAATCEDWTCSCSAPQLARVASALTAGRLGLTAQEAW